MKLRRPSLTQAAIIVAAATSILLLTVIALQATVVKPMPAGPNIRPDQIPFPPLYLVQEQSGGSITGLQRVGQFLLENTRQFLIDAGRPNAENIPAILTSCFACHPNGHTNGSFVPSPDGAPLRYDAPSIRGAGYTSPFGFKRQIPSLEAFAFTEIRSAHTEFDAGDPPYDENDVEGGGGPSFTREELDAMAAFMRAIDFPPAPKLNAFGKLDRSKATKLEYEGQRIFFGRAKCGNCHPAPFYTDLKAYDLRQPDESTPTGVINTPTLRGIRHSPPYCHDGRYDGMGGTFPDGDPIDLIDVDAALLETVEGLDEALNLQLKRRQKDALVAFMKAL
jgi:hypothetical protein